MATIVTRNGKSSDFTRELTVEYELGSNLEEAIELFGADAVYNGFVADARVAIQAIVRAGMKPDKDGKTLTDEEIRAKVAEYKVGSNNRVKVDPMEKVKALLGKMTPEQRAALLAAAGA